MICTLKLSPAVAAIAQYVSVGGNAEAVVAENLRLQTTIDAAANLSRRLEDEVADLRSETDSLRQSLKDATAALAAISGTLAIYQAHQK